jgi:hypothetical protein
VPIQGLDDREPDGAGVSERLLRPKLSPRGILAELPAFLAELPEQQLESLVAPSPVRIGLTPIGLDPPLVVSHLAAQVTELFEDELDPRIEVSAVLSVWHGHTLSTAISAVNVAIRIRRVEV